MGDFFGIIVVYSVNETLKTFVMNKRRNSPTILFLVLTMLLFLSFAFAEEKKPYQKQDSDHIKQIFESWDSNKGPWLYESMGSILLQEEMPERPESMNKTTYELLSEMTDHRKNRILRAASVALEEEKENAEEDQIAFFWDDFSQLIRSTDCEVRHGRSNGDPHMTTFDGEKYDFQTAGEYWLTRSKRNNFEVQTRQVRHNSKISVNGAAVVNVNGDIVSMYAQDFPDDRTDKFIRINGEVFENDREEKTLPNGAVLSYINGRNVIFSPTGEHVYAKTRTFQGSKLIDIDIFIPSCGDEAEGLLGNADGDSDNDLIIREPIEGRDDVAPDVDRSDSAVFGEGRHSEAQRSAEVSRLEFISRDFGDQFIVREESSMFEIPMTDITDDIRYPFEHLTLSELTDEEVEEASKSCREAGVTEENLMECVYDLAYVGLEPDLPPVYIAPVEAPKDRTVPQDVYEDNNDDKKKDDGPFRMGTGTRIGGGIFSPTPRGTRTSPTKTSPTRTSPTRTTPTRTPR